MSDRIRIHELEIWSQLGVPEEERAQPQRLLVTLDLYLDLKAAAASDDVSDSVNYFTVAQKVRAFASAQPRLLLERLTEDLVTDLLATFPVEKIEIEIKKFVLPEAGYVSVKMERSRRSPS